MPWHVAKSAKCPLGKPWAVIKDSDQSVAGCHPSKDKALKQQAALYANEPGSSSAGGDPMTQAATARKPETPPRDNLVRGVFPFELRDVAERKDETLSGSTMFGHFAVFDRWTEVDSFWEGRFLESIAPGAFTKTFKENRDGVKVTFNHGHDVLGDQILGPIDELREDDTGAYYEVPLYEGVPPLLLNGLRGGAYGASFRFKVTKEELDKKPDLSATNPEGIPERVIKEVSLMEFGPVTFPAYADATAGVRMRSLTDDYVLQAAGFNPERLERLMAHRFDELVARRFEEVVADYAQRTAAVALQERGAEEPHSAAGAARTPLTVIPNTRRR